MINPHHEALLTEIIAASGKGTSHTFLDSYLGNKHPRYPITAPVLRTIARNWMRNNKSMEAEEFCHVVDSLIKGESSTEKVLGGILMDYASFEQGSFDPGIFIQWLDHLEGWAEIDAACTGAYTIKQIPPAWSKWKTILKKLSKDEYIGKRRASLVFLCSPLSHCDDSDMAATAFQIIDTLRYEKEVLITKAISWVLRSMVRYHRKAVEEYVKNRQESLPKVAVRETITKLKTGRKTRRQ